MAWSPIQEKKGENRKNSAGVGWRYRELGEGGVVVGQNFKKGGGVLKIEGLYKIAGLVPLCQLCKETWKTSHPPLQNQHLHSWLSPVSRKNFPSPRAIFKKFPPSSLWRRRGRWFELWVTQYQNIVQFWILLLGSQCNLCGERLVFSDMLQRRYFFKAIINCKLTYI